MASRKNGIISTAGLLNNGKVDKMSRFKMLITRPVSGKSRGTINLEEKFKESLEVWQDGVLLEADEKLEGTASPMATAYEALIEAAKHSQNESSASKDAMFRPWDNEKVILNLQDPHGNITEKTVSLHDAIRNFETTLAAEKAKQAGFVVELELVNREIIELAKEVIGTDVLEAFPDALDDNLGLQDVTRLPGLETADFAASRAALVTEITALSEEMISRYTATEKDSKRQQSLNSKRIIELLRDF
ncbi:MAG: hypothetical protein M1814_002978 [Vezdaea aestivalis]|nr:MAG: hypothetical protein M1814_002978 [Vezdaea aestivalis]